MNVQTPTRPKLAFSARELDLIKYTLHNAPEVTQNEAQRIIAKIEKAG